MAQRLGNPAAGFRALTKWLGKMPVARSPSVFSTGTGSPGRTRSSRTWPAKTSALMTTAAS